MGPGVLLGCAGLFVCLFVCLFGWLVAQVQARDSAARPARGLPGALQGTSARASPCARCGGVAVGGPEVSGRRGSNPQVFIVDRCFCSFFSFFFLRSSGHTLSPTHMAPERGPYLPGTLPQVPCWREGIIWLRDETAGVICTSYAWA